MGKTNPTYRDELRGFEEEWSTFRDWLRRDHQSHFDRLVEQPRNHVDAAGAQNPVEPTWTIIVSICLAQHQELSALQKRLDSVERCHDK